MDHVITNVQETNILILLPRVACCVLSVISMMVTIIVYPWKHAHVDSNIPIIVGIAMLVLPVKNSTMERIVSIYVWNPIRNWVWMVIVT